MLRRRLLFIAPFTVALPALLLSWLLLTQSGLQTAAAVLSRTLGGQLQLEQLSGRLADRLQIGKLQWTSDSTTVAASAITLDWSPLALGRGVLDVAALQIGALDITTRDSGETLQLPETLALPVRLNIGELALGPLRVNEQLIAERSGAALGGDAARYLLKNLRMQRGKLELKAGGSLGMHKPYALQLDATLAGKVEERDFMLALTAGGDLERSEFSLQAREAPFALAAQGVLHPFAAQPLSAFTANADRLDLAALLPELPQTRISADCRSAAAKNDTLNADCRIHNALAGPVDQGRLPLKQGAARLSGGQDQLRLSDITLLIGAGGLQGDAEWSAGGGRLTLNAQALSLADLHSRLQRTQLNGPLKLSEDKRGLALELALRDNNLAIETRLQRRNAQLQLERLLLDARGANLTLQGQMDEKRGDFTLAGRFDRFDPAQFMRAPAGSLNGDLRASGRITPSAAPQFTLDFALRDSRLANAPASGRGHVDLAGRHLRKADLSLLFGANRARLAGAFGQAGEKLRLDIEAPALAPYGIEGDLAAHLEAGGRLDAPLLNGQLRSASLRLPGTGKVRQLSLDAAMGAAAGDPMNLRLQFERLDLSTRAAPIRQFDLEVRGKRREHALNLSALLNEDLPLRLEANGGLMDKGVLEWQGALNKLTLEQASTQRFLRLQGSAPLIIGSTRWSLGPAQLQSRKAALRLSAGADAGKLQLALSADNPEVGHAGLELAAKVADAWNLSAQMPWQGRLQAAIGDLGWANDLLGSSWQASGRLDVDVQIAGTPQSPLLNGRINGSALGLQHLDTRMQLRDGSLRASLRDSILSLDEFEMLSTLTAPPPALQRSLDEGGRALVATPGRISASGRMKLGALGGAVDDQLMLNVTLDRLGVSQTPKQWLLLSGQGRLGWQQTRLGVQAKLAVDAAHWQIADLSQPQLSDDVIVHREGNAGGAARKITPWSGEVQISLGRHFSFAGAGARGRLAGQVQISASAQDLPRASGTVNLINGRYEAYGQQLDIERGILNFQGLLENPSLNILALRKGLPVEAGVEITGFAQAPRIRLVSEPNVPDAEKLSWLVLGRPPEHEGGDAGVLMAAVGAIFGNRSGAASQQLKDSFGIDEISVRSGTPGQQQNMRSSVVSMNNSSASSGQVFAVGKQLSSRLRLSYEQAIGGADSLVKLTFKLTDRIFVVGTSGTDAALDVFYSFTFGGKPTPQRQP